jgi:hypothetical protein
MENRNGDMVSPQISVMGVLSTENDFSLKGTPFCIKNDGETAVWLEVNLKGMKEGDYVQTLFEIGWNPEIVRKVKSNSDYDIQNLKWGY